MMVSTTVTSKGQVTIPKRIRELLGVQAGTKVDFKVGANGQIVLQRVDEKLSQQPDRFAKWVGFLGPSPSTDEIMALLRGED